MAYWRNNRPLSILWFRYWWRLFSTFICGLWGWMSRWFVLHLGLWFLHHLLPRTRNFKPHSWKNSPYGAFVWISASMEHQQPEFLFHSSSIPINKSFINKWKNGKIERALGKEQRSSWCLVNRFTEGKVKVSRIYQMVSFFFLDNTVFVLIRSDIVWKKRLKEFKRGKETKVRNLALQSPLLPSGNHSPSLTLISWQLSISLFVCKTKGERKQGRKQHFWLLLRRTILTLRGWHRWSLWWMCLSPAGGKSPPSTTPFCARDARGIKDAISYWL